MTWITDGSGTRWVVIEPKTKRSPPRALRFAELKVGDQIMLKPRTGWNHGIAIYYLVTDLWFDPVEGQRDPLRGSMVGYSHIKQDGSLSSKSATTVRGLASQQFVYADIDYIALCQTRIVELETGKVIGIGVGKAIRARPKISGL